MSKSRSQPPSLANGKQGQYSDGHPLDEVQYLECKLILKPDRFTAAKVFLDYGKLVAKTAKEFGVEFANKGIVVKPAIREVVFLDTADFRLYNHAFILRQRVAYELGFPAANRKSFSSFATTTCKRSRHWTCGRTLPATFGSNSRRRLCR